MARIDKINEEVHRELASVIRELKDSRIPMMTSVVAVNVTNDLRYAKAYVSVMGDKETQKKARSNFPFPLISILNFSLSFG